MDKESVTIVSGAVVMCAMMAGICYIFKKRMDTKKELAKVCLDAALNSSIKDFSISL